MAGRHYTCLLLCDMPLLQHTCLSHFIALDRTPLWVKAIPVSAWKKLRTVASMEFAGESLNICDRTENFPSMDRETTHVLVPTNFQPLGQLHHFQIRQHSLSILLLNDSMDGKPTVQKAFTCTSILWKPTWMKKINHIPRSARASWRSLLTDIMKRIDEISNSRTAWNELLQFAPAILMKLKRSSANRNLSDINKRTLEWIKNGQNGSLPINASSKKKDDTRSLAFAIRSKCK